MNENIDDKEAAPPSLRFSGLSFTVRQNGGCKSQPVAKQLLKGACGVADGGRVTAIAVGAAVARVPAARERRLQAGRRTHRLVLLPDLLPH